MFAGTVTAGGVVSCTVTLKLWLAVSPRVSLAVHVTIVCPIANVEPDAGLHTTGRLPSTRSVAVGAGHDAVAPVGPVASTVMSLGIPLNAGGVVSCTVTVKLPVPVLLCTSFAEQFTVVVPSANVEPDAGAHVGAIEPSTMS